MSANRWEQIERIFNRAVLLPVAERKTFVEESCGADDNLLFEVTSLLDADSGADEILNQSVFPLVAQLLDDDFSELLEKSDFAHYKLKKLLGRGGMGAVYLAEDTRLGRLAAIKVLPPNLAADAQSLARFQREARAASALSHPNVAHVYEFGEADGRSFLAMEYVEGQTLRQLINEKSIGRALSLSIAAQVASALRSTHECGIVHRDIKPENIIVRVDGLAKVLDFGLAKSNEPPTDSFSEDEAARSDMRTQAGMILGTVGYMSPEQIRGQETGAPTDLWSLGVVLFEMLTGTRPFQGETPSDVQAAILKDEPLALDDAADINRIIRKALSKNVAGRYRSAQEFAEDIERAQSASGSNIHDSGSRFAVGKTVESHGGDSSFAGETGAATRRKSLLPVVLIAVAVAGLLGFQFAFRRQPARGKFAQTRAERVTNNGNALRAAISPDGKSLAYVFEEAGNRGVFLRRRTASGAFSAEATALVAPASGRQIRGVSFAPGGETVYFRAKSTEDTAFHIYRVPTDGGEPQKIIDDAQSTPSFSPDGARLAFLRANQDNSRGDLIIADADGANERILYTRRAPDFFSVQAQPAWSPDGNTILCSGATKTGSRELMVPLAVGVGDGQAQPVFENPWQQIWTTQWVEDGSAFIMTGRQNRSTDNNQLWHVAYPGGETARLTDDFHDYYGVSIASRGDGAAELASVILSRKAQLWKINPANRAENPQPLTEPGGDDGYGVSWAQNGGGGIFYGSTASGNPDLWTMNADGSDRRQLTFDTHLDSQPTAAPDGRYVVFGSLRSGIESLWRMKADGSEQTLLVEDAHREPLAVTPGGTIYYHSTADGAAAMWRVSLAGGQPEKVFAGKYFPAAASPDGKFIAAAARPDGAKAYSLAVFSVDETSPRAVREFKPADGAELPGWARWSPGGESIIYTVTRKGVSNLWSQPAAGGEPKQLTDFANGRIYSFDFSPDGSRIICARGELSGYVVLLSEAGN